MSNPSAGGHRGGEREDRGLESDREGPLNAREERMIGPGSVFQGHRLRTVGGGKAGGGRVMTEKETGGESSNDN